MDLEQVYRLLRNRRLILFSLAYDKVSNRVPHLRPIYEEIIAGKIPGAEELIAWGEDCHAEICHVLGNDNALLSDLALRAEFGNQTLSFVTIEDEKEFFLQAMAYFSALQTGGS